MAFTLKRDVYCHEIINPPKQNRGSDIDLILTKSNNLIILERIFSSPRDRTFVTNIQWRYLILHQLVLPVAMKM